MHLTYVTLRFISVPDLYVSTVPQVDSRVCCAKRQVDQISIKYILLKQTCLLARILELLIRLRETVLPP